MAGTMFMGSVERIIYGAVEELSWEGSVEAPTGAWTQLILQGVDSEWPLVMSSMAQLIHNGEVRVAELTNFDFSKLAGFWIITEDSSGHVAQVRLETYELFQKVITSLESEYSAWDAQD